MNYSDRIEAAKYLYRRCHRKSIDDADTMLNVVEDALQAGMMRHFMSNEIALDDFLSRVISYKRINKERIDKIKLKNDELRRKQLLTTK